MAELILTRHRSYFGLARAVNVDIDGQRAAAVLMHGVTLQVPEGHHQLVARMDWIRSEVLPLELRDASPTTVQISVPFWKSVLATFAAGKVTTFAFRVTTT